MMTYHPIGNSSARNVAARPAVGGRRAPVTARGRAVLDESRRRLQQAAPPHADAQRLAA